MERINQIFSFDVTKPLLFTQLDFWLFFLVVMVFLSMLHKNLLMRSIFLTAVSLFFYFKTSGVYVILLGSSVVVNYLFGQWVYNARQLWVKKMVIAISVILNLTVLGFFKYAYFFAKSYDSLFQTNFFGEGHFVEKIILPVGVSFFTFQTISYVVDIYRQEIKPVKNFFDYSFFVTFFPQLLMGPIVKAKEFVPQIYQPYELNKAEFSSAIVQIVRGLIKKLILADYISAHFVDKVVDNHEAYPGFVSIIAMWGYSLQIYGDFSGYTDMAIGLSRLMGFRLRENFISPYKAINVADFWRRWHRSLGTWLRDYLYIPLGGNRTAGTGTYIGITVIFIFLFFITQWYELIFVYVGLMSVYLIGILIFPNFRNYLNRDLNMLITMVAGGIWHGASENFVIWSSMNGIALIVYSHWKKISPYENSNLLIAHFWKIFLTFNFITFTRIWFRLDGDGEPMEMLNYIINHFDFSWDSFVKLIESFMPVMIIMVAGFTIHWLPDRVKDGFSGIFRNWPSPVQAIAVSVIIFLVYQAVADVSKPFVYFQF